MAKEFKDWIDEFVENGANPKDVINWPKNAGGEGGMVVVDDLPEEGDPTLLYKLPNGDIYSWSDTEKLMPVTEMGVGKRFRLTSEMSAEHLIDIVERGCNLVEVSNKRKAFPLGDEEYPQISCANSSYGRSVAYFPEDNEQRHISYALKRSGPSSEVEVDLWFLEEVPTIEITQKLVDEISNAGGIIEAFLPLFDAEIVKGYWVNISESLTSVEELPELGSPNKLYKLPNGDIYECSLEEEQKTITVCDLEVGESFRLSSDISAEDYRNKILNKGYNLIIEKPFWFDEEHTESLCYADGAGHASWYQRGQNSVIYQVFYGTGSVQIGRRGFPEMPTVEITQMFVDSIAQAGGSLEGFIPLFENSSHTETITEKVSVWHKINESTSYSAGSGININNQNEISVDTTVVQPKLTKGSGININNQNEISVDTTVVQPKLTKGLGISINNQNEISVDTIVVQPRLAQGSGININNQNKISVDGSIQRSLNAGLGLFINNNTLSINWNVIQKKIVPDYGVMIKNDYLLSTKPTAIMIPETAVTYEALGLDTSAQYVLNFSGLSWCLYRMGVDTDASFVREDEEESVISIGASHLSGSGAPALVYIRCINSGGGSDIQVNIECFGDSLHPNTLIYLPSAEYTIGNLLEKLQNYFDNEGKYMLSLKTLDYPSTLNNLYTNEIIITRKTIADYEYHLIDDVREFINTIVDIEGSGSSS